MSSLNSLSNKLRASWVAAFCHPVTGKTEIGWSALYFLALLGMSFFGGILTLLVYSHSYPPPLSELRKIEGVFRYAEVYDLHRKTTIEMKDGRRQLIGCNRRPPCTAENDGKPAVAWLSNTSARLYQLHINSIVVLDYWSDDESASNPKMASGRNVAILVRFGFFISLLFWIILIARWTYSHSQLVSVLTEDINEKRVSKFKLLLVVVVYPALSLSLLAAIFRSEVDSHYDGRVIFTIRDKIRVDDEAWSIAAVDVAVQKRNARRNQYFHYFPLRIGNRLFEYRRALFVNISSSDCEVEGISVDIKCSIHGQPFVYERYSVNDSNLFAGYKLKSHAVSDISKIYEFAYIPITETTHKGQVIFCIRMSGLHRHYCRGEVRSPKGEHEFAIPRELLPAYAEIREAIAAHLLN